MPDTKPGPKLDEKGFCQVCNHAELKKKTKSIKLLKELSLLIGNKINYSNYKSKQRVFNKYLEETRTISGKKIDIKIDDLIRDLRKKAAHMFTWLNKNEWLKEGFFNGYYDNSFKPAEGKKYGKIRMMLASQVFPIMSNGVNKARIEKIWLSIKKHLQDKKLGGFRLNTNFGSLYMDLGRAFGFSYGDKENGAFFSHMAVMLGFSLYKAGFIKEGFQVINSIYKMATNPKAKIYPIIPEYFNNSGQGLYLYLTGSASWYIYTLLEQVLGIKFLLGDLVLEPKLGKWNFYGNKIDIRFKFLQKDIKVSFLRNNRKEKIYKIKKVLLENRQIAHQGNQCRIKKAQLKSKTIAVKVLLD